LAGFDRDGSKRGNFAGKSRFYGEIFILEQEGAADSFTILNPNGSGLSVHHPRPFLYTALHMIDQE
jgi:hypothetical protein